MSKPKPPRPKENSDKLVIDKLSRLITAQQVHVDSLRDEVEQLRLTNKGLVALLATANCQFCNKGLYDWVDMETGEVVQRPCLHCSSD